jgi:hypothetical protein
MHKAVVLCGLAIVCATLTAHADTLGTYDDVKFTPGGFKLTSDTTAGPGYAGIYDAVSGVLTPTTLTQLSVDYQMLIGTFHGGAPRFSIIDTTSNTHNEAYVYFGTPHTDGSFSDPANGSPGSTGNYADPLSTDVRVYNNGFGGVGNGNTGQSWAQFVASVPNIQIAYISLDLDGGWGGTQQMLVPDFTVNSQTFTAPAPLPKGFWAGLVLLGSLGVFKLGRSLSSRSSGSLPPAE